MKSSMFDPDSHVHKLLNLKFMLNMHVWNYSFQKIHKTNRERLKMKFFILYCNTIRIRSDSIRNAWNRSEKNIKEWGICHKSTYPRYVTEKVICIECLLFHVISHVLWLIGKGHVDFCSISWKVILLESRCGLDGE